MPCVIFHTGRSRWVISKELDDGAACFAFVQDSRGSKSPAECRQSWSYFDTSTQRWGTDAQIVCTDRAAASDPFLRLKEAVDAELAKVGVTDERKRTQLWRKCDVSGDGYCDLMEIEALISDMTKTKIWPDFMNCDHEVVAMAFKRTLDDSIDGDSHVDKDEFHQLLSNVFWFAKLHSVYAESSGSDQDLSHNDFRECMQKMGVPMTQEEVSSLWSEIDADNSGAVSFEEFCVFMRGQVCGPGDAHEEAADKHNADTLEAMKKASGDAATMGGMVKKKNFADFDRLEKKIKSICAEQSGRGATKLWRCLDYNGNGYVSLAEVDKFVVEKYPLLNHKPALMRAFQASKNVNGTQTGFAADNIERKEFKLLLINLFYYNKLFWLFDQADQHGHDRRMDFEEWQWCLTMTGVKLSQAAAKAEFRKIDRNGGGMILFDEFCQYFVNKQCPAAMTNFLADDDA